jgi:hypothetical protein
MFLTADQRKINYVTYVNKLQSVGGYSEELFSEIGERLINAPMNAYIDSGLAYLGAFIYNSMRKIAYYAVLENEKLDESERVDKNSIVKVALLNQISKAIQFEPNSNKWELENRGIAWKYNETDVALRTGERSLYLCSKYGIQFTPEEFEAMLICDKTDDDYSKIYSSTLSVLIKNATNLVYNLARINYKKELNKEKNNSIKEN